MPNNYKRLTEEEKRENSRIRSLQIYHKNKTKITFIHDNKHLSGPQIQELYLYSYGEKLSISFIHQHKTSKLSEVKKEVKVGKWDRSVPKPYWENIGEVHIMGPAKFIKFNTPLGIPEENSQLK